MCHNFFSHHANNFVVFRNAIQKAIQEKRFKFAEKQNQELLIFREVVVKLSTVAIFNEARSSWPLKVGYRL